MKVQHVVFASLLISGIAADAFACSSWCIPDNDTILPAENAVVPANLTGFIVFGFDWMPYLSFDFRVTEVVDGTSIEVPILMKEQTEYRFEEPLKEGSTYRVEWLDTCMVASEDVNISDESPTTVSTTFQVGPAVLFPTTLGTLSADAPTLIHLGDACDSCFCESDVHEVQLHVALSEDAKAWGDLLVLETHVNGALWNPSESKGDFYKSGEASRHELVYLLCNTDRRLTPGPQEIHIEAHIPGGDQIWASNAITVTLDCLPPTSTQVETGTDGCTQSQGYSGWIAFVGFLSLFLRRRR